MNKLIKNYVYNFLYAIFTILMPLITAPYLARTLQSHALGEYGYVNSIVLTVSSVIMLGTYDYGVRQIAYVRDDKKKTNLVFWKISYIRMILTIIGTIIYLFCIFLRKTYFVYFLIYYSYILSCCLDCTWLFVGMEDMKWAVTRNLITKILAVVGIFLFIKKPSDIFLYFAIQGGAALVSSILAYIKIGKYVSYPIGNIKGIRNILINSIMLYLPSITATLYLQCD